MQMKSQLSQMMFSLKQKDDIINQQNMKLSLVNGNNLMNGYPNMNQYNPNMQSQFKNNLRGTQNGFLPNNQNFNNVQNLSNYGSFPYPRL